MRRLLLLLTATALGPGCACDDFSDDGALPPLGGGAPGPTGQGRVSGTVTPFQGAMASGQMTRVDPALRRAVKALGAPAPGAPPAPPRVTTVDRALMRPAPEALGSSGRLLGAREPLDFVPGELVVRLVERLPAERALELVKLPGLLATHGGFSSEHLHLVRYRRADTRAPPSAGETRELLTQLSTRPGVVFAELNFVHHPFSLPNDPLLSSMWHLPPINLSAAWAVERGASSVVTVAVVDTGIFAHPDLTARLLPGADLISDAARAMDGDGRDGDASDTGRDLPNGESSWHGTHCAGTIGASTDNGAGIAGVNWNARLVPVRVLGKGGGTSADIAAGMAWAAGLAVPGMPANAHPAQVVNLSLGGQGGPLAAYQDVIDQAAARNVLFVVAAGNDAADASDFTPCNQTGVLCIGATRPSGRRASYSNYGSRVDLMAPGGETAEDANGDGYPDGVLSTLRNDATGMPTYAFEQGTSMAAPHVAGVVSLMRARNPSLTFAQARQILVGTATAGSRCNEGCGAGLLNAHAALLRTTNSQPSGPARLSLSATDLFFTRGATSQRLTFNNTGGMPLDVRVAAVGAAAARLSFDGTQRLVGPGQSATVQISADLSGLQDGRTEAATVNVTSNGGAAAVGVKLRATGGSTRPVTVALVFQQGEEWKVAGVVDAPATQNYAFTVEAPAGRYFLVGLQDANGNGQFEDDEPIGLWPNSDSPKELTLAAGQAVTGRDFVVAPQRSVTGDEARLIGAACADDATCGEGGVCAVAFPGGYCTRDCSASACPAGSKCASGETVALCLDTCTAPRSGRSTCRASYVCEADGTGQGFCVPSCATLQDFCEAPQRCNTTSGYCE
ncbi:MAG: S8 family peptidase [Myxococcaceae bacterium]|nr:S8 family peptidase [Myxococcaceae bacterium]